MSKFVFVSVILAVVGFSSAAQAGDFVISPRLGLGAGYDGNYRYAPAPVSDSITARGNAGIGLAWGPSMRWLIRSNHSLGIRVNRRLENTGEDDETLYIGDISALYLPSLRTRAGLSTGGLFYRGLDGFDSSGAWFSARAGWIPSGRLSFWFSPSATVLDTSKPNLGLRRDLIYMAKGTAGYQPTAWSRLLLRAVVGHNESSYPDFDYRVGETALKMRLGRSVFVEVEGEFRRRWFLDGEVDRRLKGEAAVGIDVSSTQRVDITYGISENVSRRFPYRRQIVKLQWHFEPAWSF